ncbi:MAG: FHA domain-containing protein [Polyangiaceae bacterium]|nr:FHA domain-containing protein [Polyangiaceae bacterium]MCW5788891.1 FHA domain-containing protein [Polyangiaceae bacterium]
MARLILATPDGQQVVELRPHNTLGRHPSNSIQLLDKIVSKEHCIVELRGDQFWLRDLGSLNGTYINAERVQGERQLQNGDEISLGATRARYFDGNGEIPRGEVWQAGGAGPSPPPGAPPTHGNPGSYPPASAPVPSQPGPPPQPSFPGSGYAAPGLPGQGLSGQGLPGQGFQPQGLPAPVLSQPGTAQMSALPPMNHTRVAVNDAARAIGTQMAATQKGFLPYDQLAGNPQQLAADYERLRLSHELGREIALERDLPTLLNKILMSVFKFVRADRGVIFLREPSGELVPGASLRRDGSETPITVSSTIMNHVIQERATVLTHDAAMDFAASKGKSMILNRISSAIVAPLLHNDDILGALWLDSETLAQFQQKDMEIVTSIAAQAAMFIEINILGRKIQEEVVNRERFSRLLSPNVAERVMSGELDVKKGGQLQQSVTVFNSDIRGFTRMSEGAEPESIVEMLNEYFEMMVETLFKYEGTLDKFMGDGIMALWGAPVTAADDPIRSVSCSLEMMEELGNFNRSRLGRELPPLAIGIGIHTGPLVAGYIGSSKALSYTVIGDTANTSARLCGVAEGGQILVSEATLGLLKNRFQYQELPPASLKGKVKPFRIFNITGTQITAQVPANLEPG